LNVTDNILILPNIQKQTGCGQKFTPFVESATDLGTPEISPSLETNALAKPAIVHI